LTFSQRGTIFIGIVGGKTKVVIIWTAILLRDILADILVICKRIYATVISRDDKCS
jgi:hypothetical protein